METSGTGPVMAILAAPKAPPVQVDSLGLHATLLPVIDSLPGDKAYEVDLPQVELPDAAATRRLNAALVQELAEVADTLPAALPAQQAVSLARPHLADSTDGNESGSFRYEVLYNAHGLLTLEFWVAQPGMSIEDIHHRTFDLRTGQPVKLSNLLTNAQALGKNWQQQRQARIKAQVAEIAKELPDDADMQAQLQQIMGWEANTRTVAPVPLAAVDFALTRHGLVLYQSFTKAFPHPYYGLDPGEEYIYSFAELRRWRSTSAPWGISRAK